MRPLLLIIPILGVALSGLVCAGQTDEGVHGNIFRNNAIGFSYTFPETFSPRVETEMPPQFQNDPAGREHMIFGLWDKPARTGTPRIAFLYDTKVRPAGLSREQMA